MARPLLLDLLRQLLAEPSFATPALLPSQLAGKRRSDRRSRPASCAEESTALKLGGSAGVLSLKDEPGLLPLVDTIVVEAKPEATNAALLLKERLLSTAEAAAFFGRDSRTLHRWRRRNLIGTVRIGRAVFYVAADIDALIRSRLTSDILHAGIASKARVPDHG